MNTKQPPFSMEAEQNVLGGLMLDNRKFFDLADKLCAEDFYRVDHQQIFAGIAAMIGAGKPCDFVTLTEHFRTAGSLADVGGLAYLGSLANDTYSVSGLLTYASIVRERSVMRRLIAAGSDIAESGYRPEGRDCNALLAEAAQRIEAIQDKRHSADAVSFGDLMPDVAESIDHAIAHGQSFGVSTSLTDLDRMTTGMHPGELWIVAGRPSMGKTTFALQMAEACAETGEAALVFSMEMPAQDLLRRALSRKARVPFAALRTGELDTEQRVRLADAQTHLRKLPLLVDDSAALSPMELRARALRRHRKHKLAMIVVDYLQYMQVPGIKDNRTNEIAAISRSLKALAKDLGIPVVALSQLNRNLETRDDKRPRMSDLRESGGIEQDADVILFPYRDEVYHPDSAERGIAEIAVAKQRNGPLGKIHAAYIGERFEFGNLAPEWQPRAKQIAPPRRGFGRSVIPFSEPRSSVEM